jgi:hypothetical protein
MEDKIENPAPPRKGETQKQFLARCHSYMAKHHPEMPPKQRSAICYDMWRKHRGGTKPNGEIFTCEAEFIMTPEKMQTNDDGTESVIPARRMIAIIGDRFMNGGFFSFDELKKCWKDWDHSLHDINHMGTSTGFFLMQQDITYFIGYHSNLKLDADAKSLSMDINIVDETKYAAAWKGFITLCEKAGKTPNVSVTYIAKRKFITASELPANIPWKAAGFGKDDLVPILYEVRPVCVSTVFMGRCSDKDGCGIAADCECGACYYPDDETFKKEIEEKIKRIKILENELK